MLLMIFDFQKDPFAEFGLMLLMAFWLRKTWFGWECRRNYCEGDCLINIILGFSNLFHRIARKGNWRGRFNLRALIEVSFVCDKVWNLIWNLGFCRSSAIRRCQKLISSPIEIPAVSIVIANDMVDDEQTTKGPGIWHLWYWCNSNMIFQPQHYTVWQRHKISLCVFRSSVVCIKRNSSVCSVRASWLYSAGHTMTTENLPGMSI